ncbi:MAG: glycosyltransferase [Flavobacteriia bacterium]|nr:glycosyltransferase [Flavobacteriia bacterium]
MPKILRIINRFNIGGPTYNATFLTRFMGEEYETLLIGGLPEKDESDSLHILEEYGVEPLLVTEIQRTPNFKSDREAYKKIKNIIKEFKPDIVHTHASKAGALGRRAAISCKVPVIVHTFHGHVFHSYFGKLKTYIFKFIERQLALKSDGIIAISELQKKELSEIHKICPANKIKVIPLGFDLEKFHENRNQKRLITRNEYDIKEDEIAIAIVGRLAPIKNHTMFLKVVEALLQKTTKKIRIFIVGDGEERFRIEEKVKNLNNIFNGKIQLTSWIKEIDAFNSGMDILCLTSDNEGTPVSLIEAQAGNLPVISTDVGGVRDIVLDNETGFIVPKNNVEMFTEKLLLLVEDNELRHKMSINGWDFVKNKFHYTTLVENMNNYYKTLLEKKKIL